jgi:predicted membrane protein
MVARKDIVKMVAKTAVKTFLFWAGIVSAIGFFFLIIGINWFDFSKYLNSETILMFGPFLIILLMFLAAVEVTYRVVNDIANKSEQNHYSLSQTARTERAHFVFYKLYETGKNFKNWDHAQKQSWDKDVQIAFSNYCVGQALDVYLLNTGRSDGGTSDILNDKYEKAMREIKLFLDGRHNVYIS